MPKKINLIFIDIWTEHTEKFYVYVYMFYHVLVENAVFLWEIIIQIPSTNTGDE